MLYEGLQFPKMQMYQSEQYGFYVFLLNRMDFIQMIVGQHNIYHIQHSRCSDRDFEMADCSVHV